MPLDAELLYQLKCSSCGARIGSFDSPDGLNIAQNRLVLCVPCSAKPWPLSDAELPA